MDISPRGIRRACIRRELKKLGGQATTRQIAEKVELSVNGTAQTIGTMDDIEYVSGKYGDKVWRLIEN